jgi:hypothetical protein
VHAVRQIVPERTPSPSLPSDVVKISAETPDALAKAVRALTTSNYDVIGSTTPGILPSLDGTPTSSHDNSPAHNTLQWTNDHWRVLKTLYEETKNTYMEEGKPVFVNTDLHNEVARKFYELDPSHQVFQR